MFKRLMTLTVLCALLVAGLGISGAGAQEQVELRLWSHQNNAFLAGTQALIDAYMAEHPNVTITLESFEYNLFLQTLQTSMPAGDEADIIQMFGTWVCSYADRLAPVPPDLAAEVTSDTFFEAQLGGYTCNDTLFGVPQEYNIEWGGVLVNKAMFEDAGLAYPPQWESWDDLVADAKALTKVGDDGQMTVAGFHFISGDGIAFQFLSEILQRGGEYWNEDMTGFNFQTPEARATLERFKAMVDEGVTDPVLYNADSNWVGTSFFTNQVGIGYIGPWIVAIGLTDYPDFGEFDYVPMPYFGDEPVFVADAGWGLVVSPNSPHQDVAWDFVRFATTDPENALAWNVASGTIPALRVVVEEEVYRAQLLEKFPWISTHLPILPYGRYVGPLPDRDLFWYEIVYPNVVDMLQGLQSIDDALMFIEEDSNAMFE